MKKKSFTIGTINYTPIGFELGYCLGKQEETHEKHIYYFNGYPDLRYKKCEIVLVKEADVATFGGDLHMGAGEDKNHKYYKGKIVMKGIGKVLSQDWQFLPGQGIQCDELIIHFGMKRTEVRTLLSNEQEFNYSRHPADSYYEFQNTSTWFNLSYDGTDSLNEIEFHGGTIRYLDIVLLGDANVKDSVTQFESLGYLFRRQEYAEGLLCEELKTIIASSEDMGGNGDKADYFYTASDISHLLEP